MQSAHERGGRVAVLGIEAVARPIKIGRHGYDEVAAMLAPVRLAQFDTGDLGHGVGPVVGLGRVRTEGRPRGSVGGASGGYRQAEPRYSSFSTPASAAPWMTLAAIIRLS